MQTGAADRAFPCCPSDISGEEHPDGDATLDSEPSLPGLPPYAQPVVVLGLRIHLPPADLLFDSLDVPSTERLDLTTQFEVAANLLVG